MTHLSFRVVLVAVVVPVLVTVVGVALQLAWLPALPATIAVHWSISGVADGFGPSWSPIVMLGVLGLVIPAIFGAILVHTVPPAGPTRVQKLLAATSLFATSYLAWAVTSSAAIQLEPALADPPIAVFLGIGAFGALVFAAAGWFVMPVAVLARGARGESIPPVEIAAGERVVWVGRARFSPSILVILSATGVLATGVVAFAIAVSGMWFLVAVLVLLAAAFLGTASWIVRVDAGGLTVRASLGWPRIRIPAAEVVSAGVTDVVPLGEFGGYGMRVGLSGRIGIITRSGEALEVERRDGRAVVITVDDAATAAGLLTAYAARAAD